MICFDKLKIITSVDYINNINTNEFISNYKQDELLYYKYHQKTPFSLLLMVDYKKNNLIIEFTSKILKDNFKNLIHKNNIEECLVNINNLGICSLNINKIINNSLVGKCDVTKTILYPEISNIILTISSNIANHSKWITKPYRNGGITIENVVSTPRYKKRLIFYDKVKELQKTENIQFLSTLSNKDEVMNYYKNRIQVELNINTMNQIRKMLNISDNNLINVLSADTNPISFILNEAVKTNNTNISKCSSLKEYEHELLLEKYDYDLKKVEVIVRKLSSKNSSITKAMKPYIDLYHKLKSDKTPIVDIHKLVA